jgi:hypothetical protein
MNQFLKATLPLLALTGSMLVAQEPREQKRPVKQTQQESQQQVITGKIVRSTDGKYVLADTARSAVYQLGNQTAAKKFDGKIVKVWFWEQWMPIILSM